MIVIRSGPVPAAQNRSGPVRSGPVFGLGSVSHWSRSGSVWRNFFRRRKIFLKTRSGRCDPFRPRIVKIGAILAIFEPFEVWKIRVPFFGEFGQSSQDLGDSDYNSIKSRDDRLNSPKSGIWIFFVLSCDDMMIRWDDGMIVWWYDGMMIWWYDDMMIWWYDDVMIWWHDDMMTWWYDDMMIWRHGDMMIWWYDDMTT